MKKISDKDSAKHEIIKRFNQLLEFAQKHLTVVDDGPYGSGYNVCRGCFQPTGNCEPNCKVGEMANWTPLKEEDLQNK